MTEKKDLQYLMSFEGIDQEYLHYLSTEIFFLTLIRFRVFLISTELAIKRKS